MALKSIAKVPNQKVARQPKCFSSSDGLVQICMTFTMVFTQNSSVFHWAVHQPIAFIQVWSLTRWFEPLTKQLWLPLRRHFFFTCTRAHKSLSNDIMQDCWIRTQLDECAKLPDPVVGIQVDCIPCSSLATSYTPPTTKSSEKMAGNLSWSQ